MDAWASPWADEDSACHDNPFAPITVANDSRLTTGGNLNVAKAAVGTATESDIDLQSPKLSLSPLVKSNPWLESTGEGEKGGFAWPTPSLNSAASAPETVLEPLSEAKFGNAWAPESSWEREAVSSEAPSLEVGGKWLDAPKGTKAGNLDSELGVDRGGTRDGTIEEGETGANKRHSGDDGNGEEGKTAHHGLVDTVSQENVLLQPPTMVKYPHEEKQNAPTGVVEPSDRRQSNTSDVNNDFGDFSDAETVEVDHSAQNQISVATLASTTTTFDIDTSLIVKLYPLIPRKTQIDPVDEIISTIPARKVWYRVSREGPIGKHDSGGEDDYIRVTWTKSAISKKVFKIVERWVSEGRFETGNTTAGNSNYGSMFGWGEGSQTKGASNRFSMPIRKIVPVGTGHQPSYSVSGARLVSPTLPSPAADFGWGATAQSSQTTLLPKQTDEEPALAIPDTKALMSASADSTVPVVRPTITQDPRNTSPCQDKHTDTNISEFDRDSLDWFEKAQNPAAATKTITQKDSLTTTENFAQGSLESFHDRQNMQTEKSTSGNSKLGPMKASVARSADDDWDEMVHSPDLPATLSSGGVNQRRPTTPLSTSHVRASSSIASIETDLGDNSYKRLSTPLAISQPTIPHQGRTTMGSSQISQQHTDPWDLSVFEQSKKEISPKSAPAKVFSGSGAFKQELNNEIIIREVIEGLPDLSYMFR